MVSIFRYYHQLSDQPRPPLHSIWTEISVQELSAVHEEEHRTRCSVLARSNLDQHQLSRHQISASLQVSGGTAPEAGGGGVQVVAGERGQQRAEAVRQDGIYLGAIQR